MASRISVKLLTITHLFLYRVTGGLVGNRIAGMPVILLTTVGVRSGKPRTIPITYIMDGGDYILTASNGGSNKNPSWFLNLQKNPDVVIRVRHKKLNAVATQVDRTSKARLWAQLISLSPFYSNYQARTSREIPMVRLRVK